MYDNLHHHFEFLKPDNIPESFKYTVFDTLIEEDVQGYGNRTTWPEDYHLHETDRLLSLLENDRDRFQKYNWVDENGKLIFPTYDCDWFGMRTHLTPKDGISLALGCSYTFGLGNHIDQTWPSYLSKELNIDIMNLGVCGGGVDTCYRLLKAYTKDFSVKNVFILIPGCYRYERFYNKSVGGIRHIRLLPNYPELTKEEQKIYDVTWSKVESLDENVFINFHKSLEAIRYICMKKNIRLFEYLNPTFYLPHESQNFDWPLKKYTSFCSVHHGPEIHEFITDKFAELYQSKF